MRSKPVVFALFHFVNFLARSGSLRSNCGNVLLKNHHKKRSEGWACNLHNRHKSLSITKRRKGAMMTHPNGAPTALAVFMTELKASRSVVGLIADNPRTNAPFLQLATQKKTDKAHEKAMRRWIATESHRIDTILGDNHNSSSSSLDDSVFALSPTNEPPRLSPIGESYKAPFKPERRDSPAHSMLRGEVFPLVPSLDIGKPCSSSPTNTNPMDIILDKQQECFSRRSLRRSLSPSFRSKKTADAPVCPRRKGSIDSPDVEN
mmetsp:Transcript_618/g.1063  ORF Transcript_618/g.1063 Transcript_618/m.1063 type:complete len:262 (+) Transcript_618:74-859(+)